jgi:hypothetical protein
LKVFPAASAGNFHFFASAPKATGLIATRNLNHNFSTAKCQAPFAPFRFSLKFLLWYSARVLSSEEVSDGFGDCRCPHLHGSWLEANVAGGRTP